MMLFDVLKEKVNADAKIVRIVTQELTRDLAIAVAFNLMLCDKANTKVKLSALLSYCP